MMGSTDDPEDGKAVAAAVFGAVGVYAIFLVFCSSQAWLHMRARGRRGGEGLRCRELWWCGVIQTSGGGSCGSEAVRLLFRDGPCGVSTELDWAVDVDIVRFQDNVHMVNR